MRERRLVLEGSFCNMNLYADGPKTYEEANRLGYQLCPRANICKKDGLGNHGCVMITGLEVARHTLRGRSTMTEEMIDFKRGHFKPSEGWIVSLDRKSIHIVPEGRGTTSLIERFAHIALDDNHPSTKEELRAVGPDFEDVIAHASTREGAIDLMKVQELEGRFGSNGGRGCDVLSGPCSCGAWH